MIYRIWHIQQSTNRRLSRLSGVDPYSRALRVLIECGAIYTVSVIILFVCYLANSNAVLPISDSVCLLKIERQHIDSIVNYRLSRLSYAQLFAIRLSFTLTDVYTS